MSVFFQKFWKFLLDLLFPAFCLGCKKEGTFLCKECQQNIFLQEEQVCPFCYQKSSLGFVCEKCHPIHHPALDGVLVAARFEEKSLLQRCIHHFKYEGLKDLGSELGLLLADVLRKNLLQKIVVCPVPLHRKRLQWRGFNQAELLALTIQKNLGIPSHQLLHRTSFVIPQMELSREKRKTNVLNAFICKSSAVQHIASDFEVLLVDDVCTTMATLEACAQALKKEGIKKVYGIVLARVY